MILPIGNIRYSLLWAGVLSILCTLVIMFYTRAKSLQIEPYDIMALGILISIAVVFCGGMLISTLTSVSEEDVGNYGCLVLIISLYFTQ